jgi:aminobenzoyl-glutamate transport protein
MADPSSPRSSRRGLLDAIEWIGNKLPDPAMLFVLGALLVMAASAVATWASLEVQPKKFRQAYEVRLDASGEPVLDRRTGWPLVEVRRDSAGKPVMELVSDRREVRPAAAAPVREGWEATGGEQTGPEARVLVGQEAPLEPIRPVNILTESGLFWALDSMVSNFMGFAPLGVVLTGMLGIGVAEKTGMIGALLKGFMKIVPRRFFTPAMVFLGIMSSLGMDAGYIVLPPLAAALYKSVGRSPLAGIAAVFAGVSAGFNANLFVTGLDPMLAELSATGARVIDPGYQVAATCNWWFMIVSTFVITGAGWFVSDFIVEKRLHRKPASEGGPQQMSGDELADQALTTQERRGLKAAVGAALAFFALLLALVLIPGSPLHGKVDPDNPDSFDRWVRVIVPLIFFGFLTPGLAYGAATGVVKNGKDVARLMVEAMSNMAPIIVLAFFAAQFIEYFRYSRLDQMLAMSGGQMLAEAEMPIAVLLIAFVLVTMVFNMFVGSMSAKYTMFAPIFIPMFMMVGISPELTQATYRIGDSVTNIITPLNAYLVIILVYMQKYVPKAGMGTLISMMMPYTVVFTVVWSVMLLVWLWLGIELGPEGPLSYAPGQE